MKTELEKEIEMLKSHIEKGKEFEAMGYDCSMMNALNMALLEQLEAKARDAT